MGSRKAVMFVVLFFVGSVIAAYLTITLLPISYIKESVYSVPSNAGNKTSSTCGGEALLGDKFLHVIFGPRPGASNVSLDSVVYVYQTRPVDIDFLQLEPKTDFAKIENTHDGLVSQSTIFYPSELLQPDTTYNVSGSIQGLTAWWTFTTTSTPLQPDYEYHLTPYAWPIAFAASALATTILATVLWKKASTHI